MFQVLFFDDESKRAAFVQHLRRRVADIGQEIRVKEMREEELLKEALTREQRAQIVETFIRHAFSKVQSAATGFASSAKCCPEVELAKPRELRAGLATELIDVGPTVTSTNVGGMTNDEWSLSGVQVLEIDRCDAGDMSGISRKKAKEVLQCELTAAEFADALGLKADSLFVDSMFTLADKDGNGYLSFQEFLDVIVIFMKGRFGVLSIA